MKKFLLIFAVLLVMLTLFFFSSQTGPESNALSSKIAAFIIRFTENGTDNSIDNLNPIVRKWAHMLLYMVLGILMSIIINYTIYRSAKAHDIKGRFVFTKPRIQLRVAIITFIVCILYACLDEIHQYFVPGRSASFIDIGFDAIGLLIGVSIVGIIGFFGRIKNSSNVIIVKDKMK